jgi:putative membrane protein
MSAPHGALNPRPADPDTRARTHLANERTFLAWLRTGLALITVGIGAARFLPIDLVPGIPYVTLFSVLLVICGTLMILYGAARHSQAAREIDEGAYQPAVGPLFAIAIVVGLLGIMAVPLIFRLR